MNGKQNKGKIINAGGDLENFVKGPDGKILLTVKNFYKFCSERKLMGVKCNECDVVLVPPRPFCPKCHSSNIDWVRLKGRGILQTYSEIHMAPPEFQAIAPYVVGLVKFEEGPSLLGIIRVKRIEDIRIGMELAVDFENVPESWVGKTRYYFKQP